MGRWVGREGFLEEVALWPELRQTLGICPVDTGRGGRGWATLMKTQPVVRVAVRTGQ